MSHIDGWDFIVAAIFFFLRGMFDIYFSMEKIDADNNKWKISMFWSKNWFRYLLSFFTALSLLVVLPEFSIWILKITIDLDIHWNIGFSGVVGYAPTEIFLMVKRKIKKKADNYNM